MPSISCDDWISSDAVRFSLFGSTAVSSLPISAVEKYIVPRESNRLIIKHVIKPEISQLMRYKNLSPRTLIFINFFYNNFTKNDAENMRVIG